MKSSTPIIVYYQADCRFCQRCVDFIVKRSDEGVFEFRDIKEVKTGGQSRYETIVVIHNAVMYQKYRACLKIGEHMRFPWPMVTKVLALFGSRIGDSGYDFVARHRGSLRLCMNKEKDPIK